MKSRRCDSKLKTYTISEYGSFISEKEAEGYVTLPSHTFSALEDFILSNNGKSEAIEFMGLSARKGIGRVITAKNYVGIITLKDGTTIEILPKVYSSETYKDDKAKKLLIEMLKTLKRTPFKSFQTTSINTAKISIFEIFIRMFIDEVFGIVKRGLRSGYESIQANERFFKGKLLFNKQVKYNYVHNERSYVEYDEFNLNRAENKLIKSTLSFLYKTTSSSKNKNDIKILLNSFSEVELSTDYDSDFASIKNDRNTKDYTYALLWSMVFLQGKSFTAFSGSEVAIALLFPMELLFESYIAAKLRKLLNSDEYSISTQDKTFHLFDAPKPEFQMKPDIVVKSRSDNSVFIIDTKWKLLSDNKANHGISQADMYQMYAYQKKYNAENVTLIYPKTDKVNSDEFEYSSSDAIVKVRFVDLFSPNKSLQNIISETEK